MPEAYLPYLAAYHSWANLRLLEFLTAEPALLHATADGVFGDALETMNHLLSAEASYLNRLRDGPQLAEPDPLALPELTRLAERLARDLAEAVTTLPEPSRLLQRRYGRVRAEVVLAQLFAHGTEHRTQVCTIAGAHGKEPPELSSWRFGGFVP